MKLVYLYSTIKMMHGPINLRRSYYLLQSNSQHTQACLTIMKRPSDYVSRYELSCTPLFLSIFETTFSLEVGFKLSNLTPFQNTGVRVKQVPFLVVQLRSFRPTVANALLTRTGTKRTCN